LLDKLNLFGPSYDVILKNRKIFVLTWRTTEGFATILSAEVVFAVRIGEGIGAVPAILRQAFPPFPVLLLVPAHQLPIKIFMKLRLRLTVL